MTTESAKSVDYTGDEPVYTSVDMYVESDSPNIITGYTNSHHITQITEFLAQKAIIILEL